MPAMKDRRWGYYSLPPKSFNPIVHHVAEDVNRIHEPGFNRLKRLLPVSGLVLALADYGDGHHCLLHRRSPNWSQVHEWVESVGGVSCCTDETVEILGAALCWKLAEHTARPVPARDSVGRERH